jgi:hypothetical protein
MDYQSRKNRYSPNLKTEARIMSNAMLAVVVILVLLLVGGLPAWPYSSGWGYYPSGGLGLVLLILLVLVLTKRI